MVDCRKAIEHERLKEVKEKREPYRNSTITFRINSKLKERFKTLCKENGIDMARTFESTVIQVIEELEKNK
jgi:hypothetical protein